MILAAAESAINPLFLRNSTSTASSGAKADIDSREGAKRNHILFAPSRLRAFA
jgi:hypothetical protein